MSTTCAWYEPIVRSRREVNTIKRDEPVVVLGNPPYKDNSRHLGGWVEADVPPGEISLLNDFVPPRDWGSAPTSNTSTTPTSTSGDGRWAMGRVFEHHQSTGHDKGAVCFITVTGFLDGPGRAWLAQYGDGAAHVTGAGGRLRWRGGHRRGRSPGRRRPSRGPPGTGYPRCRSRCSGRRFPA